MVFTANISGKYCSNVQYIISLLYFSRVTFTAFVTAKTSLCHIFCIYFSTTTYINIYLHIFSYIFEYQMDNRKSIRIFNNLVKRSQNVNKHL